MSPRGEEREQTDETRKFESLLSSHSYTALVLLNRNTSLLIRWNSEGSIMDISNVTMSQACSFPPQGLVSEKLRTFCGKP